MSDTEDFAALFEASLKAKRVEQGQTIEGTIVGIGPEVAFVDVGGKGEATIDVAELKDAEGDLEVAERWLGPSLAYEAAELSVKC